MWEEWTELARLTDDNKLFVLRLELAVVLAGVGDAGRHHYRRPFQIK